jgi:hypothetical protein
MAAHEYSAAFFLAAEFDLDSGVAEMAAYEAIRLGRLDTRD